MTSAPDLLAQVAIARGANAERIAEARASSFAAYKVDPAWQAAARAVTADALPRLVDRGWVRRNGDPMGGLGTLDHRRTGRRLIHSVARELDGLLWSHVSFSRRDGKMPSWEETRNLFWLVHPLELGVIVVAPRSEHVNMGEVAHVWACLDGRPVPDFTRGTGSI